MVTDAHLQRLIDVFLAENAITNLSAFRTPALCRRGNIDDSFALLSAEGTPPEILGARRILDMGTGGGFPLLPLALAMPDATFVGVDSVQKKIAAIARIVKAMDIHNVTLHATRLEEIGRTPHERETYDLVTARALAELPILLEYAAPLLVVGGWCAFWKSDKIAQELASTEHAQRVLHMAYSGSATYDLGDGFGKRTILFFRKKAPTPAAYPRSIGTPKKEPL